MAQCVAKPGAISKPRSEHRSRASLMASKAVSDIRDSSVETARA
jgi:hypothetical protein